MSQFKFLNFNKEYLMCVSYSKSDWDDSPSLCPLCLSNWTGCFIDFFFSSKEKDITFILVCRRDNNCLMNTSVALGYSYQKFFASLYFDRKKNKYICSGLISLVKKTMFPFCLFLFDSFFLFGGEAQSTLGASSP